MSTESTEADSQYGDHLKRSRRMWDRWSDYYGMSERDFEPMRETAMAHLDLDGGERVLDVGCGPGVNLASLQEAVGPEGQVVAVDYSPEMVAAARERVEEHGWEHVDVRLADATSVEFDGRFDGAIASLSMSVMPDVPRTVENVSGHLRPGARFVVFDIRPVPSGPLRIGNPLLRGFLRWYANWNPEDSVLDSLQAAFDECNVVETYMRGVTYTVRCEQSSLA